HGDGHLSAHLGRLRWARHQGDRVGRLRRPAQARVMRAFEPLHPRLRISALSVFAFGAISRGVAYVNAPSTSFTTFVDAVVPLRVWAFVWIGAGLLLLAGIWHRVVARWALSFGGSLWAVWGLSFYLSWI